MKRAVLAVAMLLASCRDAELRVSLSLPQAIAAAAKSVRVEIFQPPVAQPFGCDALAMGDVTRETARAHRTATFDLGLAEAPLEVDRYAEKVFVADVYAAAGERIATACGETGAVLADTRLRLVAEPAPRAVALGPAAVDLLLGTTSHRVEVRLEDSAKAPLTDIMARWTVHGPAGVDFSGGGMSRDDGVVSLNVEVPNRPGPFVSRVSARWQEGPPVTVQGAVMPQPRIHQLPAQVAAYRVASLGPRGEPRLAALVDVGAMTWVEQLPLSGGPVVTSPFRFGSGRLGVLPGAGNRDRLVQVGASWDEVQWDGGLTPSGTWDGGLPVDLVSVPPCGSAAPGLLVSYGDGGFEARAVDGTVVPDGVHPLLANLKPTLLGAGCVSQQSGGAFASGVISIDDGSSRHLLGLGQTVALIQWTSAGDSHAFSLHQSQAGFVTARSLDDEYSLYVSIVDDLVDPPRLKSISHSPSLADIPNAVGAGDLDADGSLDYVALTVTMNGIIRTHSLWFALGRNAPSPVSGMHDLGALMLCDPALHVLDSDADGRADVVLVDRDAPGCQWSSTKVVVYSMRGT